MGLGHRKCSINFGYHHHHLSSMYYKGERHLTVAKVIPNPLSSFTYIFLELINTVRCQGKMTDEETLLFQFFNNYNLIF